MKKVPIEKIVKSWIELCKYPAICSGHLSVGKSSLSISSLWSVTDPSRKTTDKFWRNLIVPLSTLTQVFSEDSGPQLEYDISDTDEIISTTPIPFDRKIQCVSHDGSLRCIVVEEAGQESAGKTEHLQIWSGETLLKSFDLGEIDLHKCPGVYTKSEAFGCTICFSPDGSKIAYLAEKKKPKTKPFFTSYSKPNFCTSTSFNSPLKSQLNDLNIKDKSTDTDKNHGKNHGSGGGEKDYKIGEEYTYQQNWGEQLSDCSQSIVVICDWDSDTFRTLEVPENTFPCDLQWAGNSGIVGTGLNIDDSETWRLGLIYCSNRASRIFFCKLLESKEIDAGCDDRGENKHKPAGNTFEFLSSELCAARSPRVSPSGDKVIWQERTINGPHDKGRMILSMSLNDPKISPTIIYELNPPNKLPIYKDFPQKCFTPDGEIFYAVTINEGRYILLKISDQLIEEVQGIEGVQEILCISNDWLLVSSSTSLDPPFLRLIQISSGRAVRLTNHNNPLDFSDFNELSNISFKFIPGRNKTTPSSIFIAPGHSGKNKPPLIVWPHGGPHSIFADIFDKQVVFFLKLGFAILRLNFVGSLGTDVDSTELLLGKIGQLDLDDCQQTVERLITSNPDLVDQDKIVVLGGSHGGFLVTHMIGTFPGFYKAAVMRNPVTDLTVQMGVSDITDWTIYEPGLEIDPKLTQRGFVPCAGTLDNLKKLWDHSGIRKVGQVRDCPVLVLVGSKDLRVPMCQGIAYYRALKAAGKEAGLKMYPDVHDLASAPVQMDVMCQAALWFLKNLGLYQTTSDSDQDNNN